VRDVRPTGRATRRSPDRAGADIDVVIVEPAGRERCTGRLALAQVRGRWRIDPGTVSCRATA
jgi:hypothetical protein